MNTTIRTGMLFMFVGLIGIGAVLADTVIPLNSSYNGTLSGNTSVWYAVPVGADGNLSVTLTPSDGVNIALILSSPEKAQIASNDSWGNSLTLSINGIKPDTYYISLWGYYPSDQSHGFTLTTVFSEAALKNDNEPNDSIAYAKILPLNDTITGHIGYDGRWGSNQADEIDWWQITTVEEGALTVNISQVDPVNLQLAIYSPDGTSVIAGADTWGNTTKLTIENLRAETVFIRVYKYAWNYTPYTLWSEFTPAPGVNDPEPNDAMVNASELAIGEHSGGHLGYNGFRDNYRVDTVDWWHFTINKTSPLLITMTQLASANLMMQLYKVDGNTLIHGGSDTWGKGYEMNIAEALPGEYYLKVGTYGVYDSYMLTLTGPSTTGIEDKTNVPNRFELLQNFPNPFNPSTTISFELPEKHYVSLRIYDILGQETATLFEGFREAGTYSVRWDASGFADGVYFAVMKAGDISRIKKMVLKK